MRANDAQTAGGREPARATPARGSPQAIIGRPFDGPGVARRIAPFIAVAIAAFGALPFMSPAQHPDEVLLAAALIPVIVAIALILPWRRLPTWSQAALPLFGLLILVLFRDGHGQGTTVFDPLLMLPVFWFALYGTRAHLGISIVAVGAMIIIPVALGWNATMFPRTDVLRAAMLMLLGGVVGFTVQRLVQEIHARAAQSRDNADALRDAEERFRRAFDDAAIGMAIVSTDGRWLRTNAALAELIGYRQEELTGLAVREITHPDDRDTDLDALRQLVSGERERFQTEKRYLHREGHVVWISLSVSVVRDELGEPLHLISQMQDITERKEVEAKLTHQALHEPVTDLPNRVLFDDRIEVALARLKRGGSLALLFLDLDRFKLINDSRGHEAGDRLLVEVAERLRAVLRPGDTLARFGGDEFTILCEDVDEAASARIAERIATSFAQPYAIDGQEIVLSASIGIVIGRDPEAKPEALLRDADVAMYDAKDRGKSRYALFESGMRLGAIARLELESQLARAIDARELRLLYQPLVSLSSGDIVGVEALVRWHHPERGVLAPSTFIPIAEESGLIVPLGEWVLGEATRTAARWQSVDRPEPLQIAVNLSARQLMRPELVQTVSTALAEARLEPSALWLEITESSVIEDTGSALKALERVREVGVKLSIDDFGMGVSSFSRVRRLPVVDAIKIDRSYVDGLVNGGSDGAIVSAMLTMAKALGLTAIAEGVEEIEQVERLRELECEMAQGFYFSPPVPAESIEPLLDAAVYDELLA